MRIYNNGNGFERVEIDNDESKPAYVCLNYPSRDNPQYVHLEICDVRANNGIRLWFDFERDGWVIERPTVFEWDCDDEVCDQGWQEVALVNDFYEDEE